MGRASVRPTLELTGDGSEAAVLERAALPQARGHPPTQERAFAQAAVGSSITNP